MKMALKNFLKENERIFFVGTIVQIFKLKLATFVVWIRKFEFTYAKTVT